VLLSSKRHKILDILNPRTKNKTMNLDNKELIDLAEKVQQQAHKAVDGITLGNPNISHQDAINTYLYLQLASLQLQINELKTKQ